MPRRDAEVGQLNKPPIHNWKPYPGYNVCLLHHSRAHDSFIPLVAHLLSSADHLSGAGIAASSSPWEETAYETCPEIGFRRRSIIKGYLIIGGRQS